MKVQDFARILEKNKIDFHTGIPDSTFKGWMSYLHDMHDKQLTNIIASNECEAIAIAAGYYLATGKIAAVYMQNSGLGKTVNPLTSLCDPEVYSIPILLMIGWRGEPGKKDEPQHKKMGSITLKLLDTLEIPHRILPNDEKKANMVVEELIKIAQDESKPVALIVKRGTIDRYESKAELITNHEMNREDAIVAIAEALNTEDVIISTTGKTSRELFEHRKRNKQLPRDFYTVGSMGCSASIALGIAMQKQDKKVYVFDGDGAVIMQMGALASIGHYNPKNLIHIVFDNQCHDSTGGQPTVCSTVSLDKIALNCGYNYAKAVSTKKKMLRELQKIQDSTGPHMLVVKVNKGARADLGRPTTTPIENKEAFMKFLR